ncbi:MAG TPA: TIGR03619 family F420-dependent LLM class oxidoreductase [Acidimicrobiia bacterium]
MRVGVHLPQYGRTAGPEAIRRAARHAEELGFADVWVSDHVVIPAAQGYPSPYLFDPLVTLTCGAAVTTRIGLGTSVLVLPHHNPLWLANALASLDALSEGRLTVGVGIGWSEAEFAALGQSFHDRGRRTDEIIDLLRSCWRDDPVSFVGDHYSFADVRLLPKPAHAVPIWVGGGSERAYRRGVERGDGFQVIGVDPDAARVVCARLRRDRPEETFTISLRTGWDPQGMEPDTIRRERDAFAAAGIQHVVSAPWRATLDDWLRSMDLLAALVLDRTGP